jgi:hypothetical protein
MRESSAGDSCRIEGARFPRFLEPASDFFSAVGLLDQSPIVLTTHSLTMAHREVRKTINLSEISGAQEAAVSVKSLEEYREVARLVRALATQASEEDARGTLLGMADFLDYFARSVSSSAACRLPSA